MATSAASSAPKPFELLFDGEYAWNGDVEPWLVGSFTSKAPFCESGSVIATALWHQFACADGSGSLKLELVGIDWSILEGTAQYAGLRGRGTFTTTAPNGDLWDYFGPFHSAFEGLVAEDTVAPTIAVASATASKVKGTKGVYTIPVDLDIRDDVGDNPVNYKVIVTRESGAGPWLASRSGEAIGEIFFEFRVRRPNAGVRGLLIRTTARDPVGNESTLDVRVRLPK